jgi:hypothetical protein
LLVTLSAKKTILNPNKNFFEQQFVMSKLPERITVTVFVELQMDFFY